MANKVISFPDEIDFDVGNIPQVLKDIPNWVLWRWENRKGKPTKPPYTVTGKRAEVNNPETWTTFGNVVEVLQSPANKYSGAGLVLTHDLGIVGWDLDKCLDPKTLLVTKWARNILGTLNTYTEITPSGHGLRAFAFGTLPKQGSRIGKLEDYSGEKEGVLEVYTGGRFLTITGRRWPEFNSEIIQVDQLELYNSLFVKEEQSVTEIKRVDKAKKLWNGEWEGDYPSQSEADLALCRYLADVADGNPYRIDELFQKSKLMRPKWLEVHGHGKTYGRTTIELALANWTSSYHLTDLGNAKRLAKIVSKKARFCYGSWYMWDGKRWAEDHKQRIVTQADKVIEEIYEEARRTESEDKAKDLFKHGRASEARNKIESMIKLASAREPLPVTPDELDNNQLAFCVKNGVIERNEFREHNPDDLITKISPIVYTPGEKSQLWLDFLQSILPDQELIAYLQRAVGYSMTGSVQEQKIFFCYGSGANGKSTFINIIMDAMGDYGKYIASSILMQNKMEQHPTGLADLKGNRMAVASELEEGRRFDEQLLKNITGGERIRARKMRENFFEFVPTSKIWIIGNHKPTIRGTDDGIWRRFHLIPFTRTIPENKQDKELPAKLKKDISGIFNWMMDGYHAWLADGLQAPQSVIEATSEYKFEQDIMGLFIEEECEVGSGFKETHKDLYQRYIQSMTENREFVLNTRQFSTKLSEKGFLKKKGAGNVTLWEGLRLKQNDDNSQLYL